MEQTVEGVEELWKLAKIEVKEMKQPIQELRFTQPLHSHDHLLVEMDKYLIEHMEQGQTVSFRGKEEDFPVLCTDKRSYAVKEAETSNTILLLPQCKLKEELSAASSSDNIVTETISVVGLKHTYLELRHMPRISVARLREVLEETPYSGPEAELINSPSKRTTLAYLLENIQGSEEEILEAIHTLPVAVIDHCYRWLDFDYLSKVVSEVLDRCDSDAINWKKFSRRTLETEFQSLPSSVLDAFLNLFARTSGDADVGDQELELKEEAVCGFMAECLLREVKSFHLDDFWKAWEESVPIGMKIQRSFLRGRALIEAGGRIETVHYFPLAHLPEDPQERFDLLFRQRTKWTQGEIVPYLEDLGGGNVSVGTLLTKYCRSTTIQGVKWYNSRERAFSKT